MENKSYYGKSKKSPSKTAMALIALLAILATIITVTVILNRVNAAPSPEPQIEVYYDIDYVYYTVEAGDSLSLIAEKYIGDYPGTFYAYQGTICRLNGIENSNRIMVGDILQIPVYTEIVKATIPTE